jgi:hypothetical protein
MSKPSTTVDETASAIAAIVAKVAGTSSSHPMVASPAPPPTSGAPRTPEIGSVVKYADRNTQSIVDAQCVRVRPTGLIDLLIYEKNGVPRVCDRVPHSEKPVMGAWSNGWNIPKPPPTLDELLAAEVEAGRPALRVGLEVGYIYNSLPQPDMNPFEDLRARRGRVERIRAVDCADIAIFRNEEKPLDPEDEDVVQQVIMHVKHDPSPGNRPNRFIYLGEAWTPLGYVRISEIRPRYRCERCQAPADPGFVADIPEYRGRSQPTYHLCFACRDLLIDFFKPIAAPVKA